MILALWYHNILATVFGLLAILLMGVILLQRGKGVGLSGAFGGTGGHTAFGAKTGDVLTWATIGIAGGLLIFTIILNFIFVPLQAFSTTPTPPASMMPAVPADGDASETDADAGGTDAAAPVAAPATETPAAPVETPAADAPAPAGGGETPAWSQAPAIFGFDQA